jgi:hypothetical protein
MSPSTSSKVTTDPDEIRHWAEKRGAKPAAVVATERGDDPGMIRLDFPGYSGAGSLKEIGWDEWFGKFDENNLALLYQEETASGERSNFNKLVSRETADEVSSAVGGRGRSARQRGPSTARKSASSRSSGGDARSSLSSRSTSSSKKPSSNGSERAGSDEINPRARTIREHRQCEHSQPLR